jgi:hypothetical protein
MYILVPIFAFLRLTIASILTIVYRDKIVILLHKDKLPTFILVTFFLALC